MKFVGEWARTHDGMKLGIFYGLARATAFKVGIQTASQKDQFWLAVWWYARVLSCDGGSALIGMR